MDKNANDIVIDLGAALKDYEQYDGLGSGDVFPKAGLYVATIEKSRATTAEKDGKPMIVVVPVAQDEDARGLRTKPHNVLCGGLDKNNKSLGRQLGDLFVSLGMPSEEVKKITGSATLGQLAAQVIGKTVYIDVDSEFYEGKEQSAVVNFVTKERYETAKAANAHRRPRRQPVQYTGAPQGVLPLAGMPSPVSGFNLGGPANGAAAPAPVGAGMLADPLKAFSGLGMRQQ